jgi:hypothetical protein
MFSSKKVDRNAARMMNSKDMTNIPPNPYIYLNVATRAMAIMLAKKPEALQKLHTSGPLFIPKILRVRTGRVVNKAP